MEKELGLVDYESISADDLVARIRKIPEVEIKSIQTGNECGVYSCKNVPSYLMMEDDQERLELTCSYPTSFGSSFLWREDFGTIINVKPRRIPLGKRVLRAIGLSELDSLQPVEDAVQQIVRENIVEHLYKKLGIRTIKRFCEFKRPVNQRMDRCDSDPRMLLYFEKIGDFRSERKIDLYVDPSQLDINYWNFHDGSHRPITVGLDLNVDLRHIVRTTVIKPALD